MLTTPEFAETGAIVVADGNSERESGGNDHLAERDARPVERTARARVIRPA